MSDQESLTCYTCGTILGFEERVGKADYDIFFIFHEDLVRKLDNICWDKITVHDQQIKS